MLLKLGLSSPRSQMRYRVMKKKYSTSISCINQSDEILQYLLDHGKLSAMEVATWENKMKKEQVAKRHKRDIYQSNGRWCTYVDNKSFKNGRQQITASTEERLYEKLYNHYYNIVTLEKLLDDWTRYSEKETNRSYKTITEDTNTYNRFIKDYSICKKDIRKLETRDYIKYFDNIFRDFNPTKKQINSIKTLIKQLYGQAVMNGLSIINPILQLDTYFKTKVYRQVDEVPGYSEEERHILLNHLRELETPNIYDFAIMLMFCFTVRIGELKALKWSDITDDSIYICKQLDTYQEERDVKKNSRKGHRFLAIPELAWDVLDKIPHEGEYILEKDGKPLLTDSFNARLKKRCTECGIRYLSSHKIRFSNCTMLLEKGVDIRDVQYAMGHTEQRMTEHYNRPNTCKSANPMISMVLTKGVQNVCS